MVLASGPTSPLGFVRAIYDAVAASEEAASSCSHSGCTEASGPNAASLKGKVYRDRYMNDAYLDALAEVHRSCEGHGLDAISVALRWLVHHSQLNAERNDDIIIGASSLEHPRHNPTAVTGVPLPTEVLVAIEDAALKAQPKWPPYFFGNEVFGPDRREARL